MHTNNILFSLSKYRKININCQSRVSDADDIFHRHPCLSKPHSEMQYGFYGKPGGPGCFMAGLAVTDIDKV